MDIRFPITKPKSVVGRAYEVLSSMRGGTISDDESVSIPLVVAMMTSAYAFILSETLSKSANTLQSIDPTLYMPYRIRLIPEPTMGKRGRVAVKRSTIPIPAVSGGKPAIRHIAGRDISFSHTSDRTVGVTMAEPRPFFGNRGAYWIDGTGSVYVSMPVSMSPMQYADVLMVPQNPFEMGNVDIWQHEVNIPDRLWENVKRMVRGDEMASYIKTMPISDKTNDAAPVNTAQ